MRVLVTSGGSKRRLTATFLVVAILCLPAPAGTAKQARKQPATMGARAVASSGGNKSVKISGWATFSGRPMASVKDPKADGEATAEAQGAQMIGADFIYRPENEDFYLRMEMTEIPPAGAGLGVPFLPPGDPSTIYGFRFTAKEVPYEIRVHNVGTPAPNDPPGQVGQAFGLFKCTDEVACTEVAKLKGGYGTAGENIVVALPLKVLRKDGTKIEEGDSIGVMYAYTAGGTYLGGPATIRDDARLIKRSAVKIPVKSVAITVRNKTKKATLKDGFFRADFPAGIFSRRGKTIVKTKTCLGSACVVQHFPIRAPS